MLVDTDDEDRIIGYVTLALTKITVSDRTELAKGIVRRMDLNDNETVGYLIGQMAKDDSVFKSIGGKMLSFAQNMLYVSYRQNGGRAICIDCKEPMIEYYRKEGFILVEPEPDKRNGLYRLVRLF